MGNLILRYLAVWIIFAAVLFIFLRGRAQRLYSDEKYEKLVTTVGSSRHPAIDPCQFFIWGDPPNAEGNFAKAIFYCSPNSKAVNSLDLSVLPSASYQALLREVGRINGFSAEPMIRGENWRCFADREKISDWAAKIKLRSRVECFFRFSPAEISKVYAEN